VVGNLSKPNLKAVVAGAVSVALASAGLLALAAPASAAPPAVCTLTGSNCASDSNIEATINPGTITITTPYTSSNPFVLPDMTLSSDDSFLQSSATFPASTNPGSQQIVVTSTLSPAYGWTVSVAATDLTSNAGTIPSSGLGFTGGALLNGGTAAGDYLGSLTFTDIPAHNPSPNPADTDTHVGLSGTPQTFAHSSATDGTADIDGLLTLYAPTSTPPAAYTGTITFSVS
jgi:hypothetical protein